MLVALVMNGKTDIVRLSLEQAEICISVIFKNIVHSKQ